jgi:hypothetical protein
MATIKTVDFERSRVGLGMKIAALALMLTAAALVTENVAFVGPSGPATAAPVDRAAAATPGALDGFALPENLKPTAADVAPQAPTF